MCNYSVLCQANHEVDFNCEFSDYFSVVVFGRKGPGHVDLINLLSNSFIEE